MIGRESVERPVLVVYLPTGQDVDLASMRDYVQECLQTGVLVLEHGTVCLVETLPVSTPILLAEDEAPTQTPPDCQELEPPGLSPHAAARLEKQAIQQRLQRYREAHGPGCLTAVAGAIKGCPIIDDMTLRDAINGAAVLPIRDWRRIGKALDGMEVGCVG